MNRVLIITYIASFETAKKLELFFNSQPIAKKCINSTWFVHTIETPSQFYQRLAPFITHDDRVFVGVLATGYEAWLPQDVWDWLRLRVSPN